MRHLFRVGIERGSHPNAAGTGHPRQARDHVCSSCCGRAILGTRLGRNHVRPGNGPATLAIAAPIRRLDDLSKWRAARIPNELPAPARVEAVDNLGALIVTQPSPPDPENPDHVKHIEAIESGVRAAAVKIVIACSKSLCEEHHITNAFFFPAEEYGHDSIRPSAPMKFMRQPWTSFSSATCANSGWIAGSTTPSRCG